MTDFKKQARWTLAAAALTSIVAAPLEVSFAQATSMAAPPGQPGYVPGQAGGQAQGGPGGQMQGPGGAGAQGQGQGQGVQGQAPGGPGAQTQGPGGAGAQGQGPGAPGGQGVQAQGPGQTGGQGPGAPGGPSGAPRAPGAQAQGEQGGATGPGGQGHGPGGPGGAAGGGPRPPDSSHGTAPGAPGSPEPGQYSPYSPVGTHLQQTLDVGKPPAEFHVRISGQTSLLHVGLGDSFSLTDAGIGAGKIFLEGLEGKPLETTNPPLTKPGETPAAPGAKPEEAKAPGAKPEEVKPTTAKPAEAAPPATATAEPKPVLDKNGMDLAKIKETQDVLNHIIPLENFGGEYTALLWFTEYLLADDKEKARMIADPFVKQYHDMFAANNYQGLKEFLIRKYHLREMGDEWSKEGFRRKAELAHTLVFNNPHRETWEKTSKLMELLKIKPGMHIADIGSGAGYYTIKLSGLVGDSGIVYAIEMEEDRISYVKKTADHLGLKNIVSVLNDGQTLALGDRKVDVALMVSLYHNIYAMSTARERNTLIQDIRHTLKPDGRLVIVDNSVVAPGTVPYHGPYVAKELVVAQLVNFGFKLVDMQQYIPQRYILVFQRDDAPAPVVAEGEKKAPEVPVGFSQPVQLAPLTTEYDAVEPAKPAAAPAAAPAEAPKPAPAEAPKATPADSPAATKGATDKKATKAK